MMYIEKIVNRFYRNPYLYFTENDIVIDLVADIKKILGKRLYIEKRDGEIHSKVHTEYATPFRCSMRKNCFEIKSENDRTPKRGKYQRGHYDIVILNGNFIRNNNSELIQGQNYSELNNFLSTNNSYIFDFGIEIMFSRNGIKYSRGKDREKGINNFIQKINQDYSKLESTHKKRLMKDYLMVVFIRNCEKEIVDKIKSVERNKLRIISA